MDPRVAAEALRQVRAGRDFQEPAKILARIPAEQACRKLPEFGYSLATNVLHADFWQRVWLAKLRGERADGFMKDWQPAQPEDWPRIRADFLAHLDEAIALAEAEPFAHRLKSDQRAIEMLLQLAVHDAYHVGQFVLLKRALRASKTSE